MREVAGRRSLRAWHFPRRIPLVELRRWRRMLDQSNAGISRALEDCAVDRAGGRAGGWRHRSASGMRYSGPRGPEA